MKDAVSFVLGKYYNGAYNSYEKVAQRLNARWFGMSDTEWKELESLYGHDFMWEINKAFINMQIAEGKSIYLSQDPSYWLKITNGNFYTEELKYLQELGYEFEQIAEELWRAVVH